MSFTPVYYVCIACPTVKRTLDMVEKYIARGAGAFQIDMPSRNPHSETEFVKAMMRESLRDNPDYGAYMEAIRDIRLRHPELEMHIVVYNDVVDAIGLQRFCAFAKEIRAASLMIPSASAENLLFLEYNGLPVFRSVTHELTEVRIQLAIAAGPNAFISLRNRKPGERDREGLETFAKKLAYLRSRGVTAPVYSVFGISSAGELTQAKEAGARGAIIGNALMRLWDDEAACFRLLDAFQALAEA